MKWLQKLVAEPKKRQAPCLRYRPCAEELEDRAVPASLLVDPNLFFAFPTIQSAINASHSGDIIGVDQATYNEDIVITKSLIIKGIAGANGQLPSIAGTGAPPVAENVVRIADNLNTVVLTGFDIQNLKGQSRFEVGIAIGTNDSGVVITNCNIHDVRNINQPVAGGTFTVGVIVNPNVHNLQFQSNNIFNITYSTQGVGASGQTAYGIFSFSRGTTDGPAALFIGLNGFSAIGDAGIVINDASHSVTLNNNTLFQIQGQRAGAGISIGGTNGKPTGIVLVRNIVNGVSGNQSSGIQIAGGATGVTLLFNTVINVGTGIGFNVSTSGVVTATSNSFQNNGIGVAVQPNFTGQLKLTANNINSNIAAGLFNASAKSVNAQINWWGALTGPKNPANPRGLGDSVFGNVDFSRFLFAVVSF